MPESMEKASRFTRDTLIPVSLVMSLAGLLWFAQGDRTAAWGQIRNQADQITELKEDRRVLYQKVSYLTEAMIRVESKLGTKP